MSLLLLHSCVGRQRNISSDARLLGLAVTVAAVTIVLCASLHEGPQHLDIGLQAYVALLEEIAELAQKIAKVATHHIVQVVREVIPPEPLHEQAAEGIHAQLELVDPGRAHDAWHAQASPDFNVGAEQRLPLHFLPPQLVVDGTLLDGVDTVEDLLDARPHLVLDAAVHLEVQVLRRVGHQAKDVLDVHLIQPQRLGVILRGAGAPHEVLQTLLRLQASSNSVGSQYWTATCINWGYSWSERGDGGRHCGSLWGCERSRWGSCQGANGVYLNHCVDDPLQCLPAALLGGGVQVLPKPQSSQEEVHEFLAHAHVTVQGAHDHQLNGAYVLSVSVLPIPLLVPGGHVPTRLRAVLQLVGEE
mmetsp:Transcript_20307/g.45162  ORF Transcript_20307/g.45162 Transcript_20307/m.45162 type:complete len:359 (+) Transcript_20307:380-1456(+)